MVGHAIRVFRLHGAAGPAAEKIRVQTTVPHGFKVGKCAAIPEQVRYPQL
jgi:hypothetical protein